VIREAVPRLMTRKAAAQYMGRCVKTFDHIRHLFVVEDSGLIRYDRELMDRYIDLHRLAA
jgi:hypothetical protein